MNRPRISDFCGQCLFNNEGDLFYDNDGVVADSSVFSILTCKFLEGNPKHALRDANAVVITDKLALKLFGTQPALNKLISISEDGYPAVNFKVTGVVKDQPKSYHHAILLYLHNQRRSGQRPAERRADE